MADSEPTGPLHQPGAPVDTASAPRPPADASGAATGPVPTAASPAAGSTATEPPAEGRQDEAGRIGEGAQPDVWEVFRQEKDGDAMRHAGNVRAPDADLATHYAREFYSRRQESFRLWVVPRTAILDLSDPDMLRPPLDRSFKKPGGYVMRDKLDEARRRATKDQRSQDDEPAADEPRKRRR